MAAFFSPSAVAVTPWSRAKRTAWFFRATSNHLTMCNPPAPLPSSEPIAAPQPEEALPEQLVIQKEDQAATLAPTFTRESSDEVSEEDGIANESAGAGDTLPDHKDEALTPITIIKYICSIALLLFSVVITVGIAYSVVELVARLFASSTLIIYFCHMFRSH